MNNRLIIFRQACYLFFMALVVACSSADPKQTVAEEGKPDILQYEEKIDSLISLMTLEEKVNMIHGVSSFTSGGVERLGIPELTMSDGPHGVRPEHGRDWTPDNAGNDSATYLPTGIALAATWNADLGYRFGEVLGNEAKARGKDVILGPGVNIIRTPLNGRNFEYLSEDPFLTSRMAVGYIKGVQDQGIAACVKHFAANNQEVKRSEVNVEMSERALREIYLPAFEAAVKEGNVLTVMGAYNKFRGQFATHHEYLVNEILKGEWGFKGVVMSDWGAVHNTMEGLLYGTDIEMGTDLLQMPNIDYSRFYMADTVVSVVRSGKVPESVVDEKVRRILRVMYATGMFDGRSKGAINTKEHQQLAQKVAEEAFVLLKNEGNILPLNKDKVKTIAVIGANATRLQAGGGGSSQVRAPYEITPLEGLKALAGNNIQIKFAPGFEVTKEGKANPALIRDAVAIAREADVVIYAGGWTHGYSDEWNGGTFDSEGADKPDLTMPFEQDQLIKAVLDANQNTVMVLFGGGAIDMSSWVGRANGILQVWYPGMEGGTALARTLFGEVNPSGKLPVTFPKKLEESPAHAIGEYPGDKDTVNVHYKEGVFVGYRYNDKYNVEPLFPFGHGLSYTTFEYNELEASENAGMVNIGMRVKNTGTVAGAEVIQLYVGKENSAVERPEKELKAFRKVFLNPGESKEVTLSVPVEDFRYFDETKNQWVLEQGSYKIQAGSSSRDIRQTVAVDLEDVKM